MMDFPAANHSRTPCVPWAAYSGRCPAGSQGPVRHPLPDLEHLSLGSPPAADLGCCLDQSHVFNQGFQSSIKTAAAPFSNTLQPVQNGPRFPCEGHLPADSPAPPLWAPRQPDTQPYVGYGQNPASPAATLPQQLPPWPFPPPLPPPPLHCKANEEGAGTLRVGNNTAVPLETPNADSSSLKSRYGLDPATLPSVVKVLADDRAKWGGKVFVSEPLSDPPPMATTSCVIEDRGNASPDAIRSTSYYLPCEGQTALLSRLPLGAVVTPLAKQHAGEPLPVCQDNECVTGCVWCGALMCPSMEWHDCGQRFYCPFCGKVSEVPWQHYQPTRGPQGVRVDKDIRPELSRGSYEIVSSQKAEPAALLLAVDVSASALRGGHLEFAVQQILLLLKSLTSQDGDTWLDVRVGVMTYDSQVHLYDLHPTLTRPHMLVITETDDLQLPVREGLLVPLRDCLHSVESVLQHLPLFSPDCEDCSGLPVELPVKVGLTILQGLGCPGKLLVFHAAPLFQLEHSSSFSGFFGSSKPKSIFQLSEGSVSLAKECVAQGCGIHVFLLSHQEVGGAWPGHIPYLTGGALHTYAFLQGEMDRKRFITDLRNSVEMTAAFKADLRIFVSKDLRVSGCYGLFIPGPNPRQVAMATVDQFTTLAVELAHTRALDESRAVAIQTVLSYSTQTGQRRTRVHTVTLRCSRHLQDTFQHYQAQTLLTFYCKKMYCAALERPLQELREELQKDVTEALAAYRKHCSSASVSTGQLVLPQCLQALPVYINSLRKSEVLLPGLRTSVPQRLQQRCQVLAMDVRSTSTHFYPQLLPLPRLFPA
ncbi:protein transport protein Sec24C isoform X2 [Nelusetta ayraudi]|uniref:protein transport protein Sec24C isoform X2 n=1 Tax=Nelusetta ayraudi TaxID=303726 RepID=UPI003F6EED7E